MLHLLQVMALGLRLGLRVICEKASKPGLLWGLGGRRRLGKGQQEQTLWLGLMPDLEQLTVGNYLEQGLRCNLQVGHGLAMALGLALRLALTKM